MTNLAKIAISILAFSSAVKASGDIRSASDFADKWLAKKSQPLAEPKSKVDTSRVLKSKQKTVDLETLLGDPLEKKSVELETLLGDPSEKKTVNSKKQESRSIIDDETRRLLLFSKL